MEFHSPLQRRYLSSSRISLPEIQSKKSPTPKNFVFYRTRPLDALKELPLTPWLAEINIKPRGSKKSSLATTDLWSLSDKMKIRRSLDRKKSRSRVSLDFRHFEREEKVAALRKKLQMIPN